MHTRTLAHTYTDKQTVRGTETEQLLLPYNFGFIKQKLAQHMTRIRLLDL